MADELLDGSIDITADMSHLPITDRERHAIARATLLNRLRDERRVQDFLDEWRGQRGRAVALGVVANDIAVAWGLDARSDLLLKTEHHARFESLPREVMAQLATWIGDLQRFWVAVDGGQADLVDALDGILDGIGVPWPWVSREMVVSESFVLDAIVFGYQSRGEFVYADHETQPAKPFAFRSARADSFSDVERKLEALLATVRAQRRTAAEPKHTTRRRVKGGGDHVARNVEWFYRVRVKEPADSIKAVAVEYYQSRSAMVGTMGTTDHRSTVRDGIAEAERCLSLVEN